MNLFYFEQKLKNGSVYLSKGLKEVNSSLRVQESEISDKISSVKLFFSLRRNFVSRKSESRVVLRNGLEPQQEQPQQQQLGERENILGSNSARILVVQATFSSIT